MNQCDGCGIWDEDLLDFPEAQLMFCHKCGLGSGLGAGP